MANWATNVYLNEDAGEMVIASGGILDIDTGGILELESTQFTVASGPTLGYTGTLTLAPTRGADAYEYGLMIDSDTFHTGGAAQKSYLVFMGGDRPAGSAASGDSNDAILRMSHTNRAVNDTNLIMRGINLDVHNRASGVLGQMEGIKSTCRQRGDAAGITGLRAFYANPQVNVGSGAVSNFVEGLFVEMQLEANMPSLSHGVRVLNRTDGVYTLPTAAFAARNNGTSGCKGFEYGLDLYDSNADTCNSAEIRMNAEVCIITNAGAPSDGTSGTGAAVAGPGSICVDITNKDLYVNTNTKASPTWKKVTRAS